MTRSGAVAVMTQPSSLARRLAPRWEVPAVRRLRIVAANRDLVSYVIDCHVALIESHFAPLDSVFISLRNSMLLKSLLAAPTCLLSAVRRDHERSGLASPRLSRSAGPRTDGLDQRPIVQRDLVDAMLGAVGTQLPRQRRRRAETDVRGRCPRHCQLVSSVPLCSRSSSPGVDTSKGASWSTFSSARGRRSQPSKRQQWLSHPRNGLWPPLHPKLEPDHCQRRPWPWPQQGLQLAVRKVRVELGRWPRAVTRAAAGDRAPP